MADAAQQELLLYDHPVSSYAQKVRIALREKGIPFRTEVPVGASAGTAEFAAANPRLEVPVLVDGDVAIFDSTIILEYIEDKWPTPPLLPKSPADRAKARMLEELCDTQYEAVNWGWGEVEWNERATGQLREHLEDQCRKQTAQLQARLESQLGEGEWFNGTSFGWADISAAPIVNRSFHYGFGPGPNTKLGQWLERVGKITSVAATFKEFEAGVVGMGGLKADFLSGKRKREYRDHRLEWMVKSGAIEIVEEGLKKNNIRFSWPEGQHAIRST